MQHKNSVRKKYYLLRKNNYYEISKDFFKPFINLVTKKFKKRSFKLAIYYPSSFEINVLKLLEFNYILNQNLLLPIIEENNLMNFLSWKKNEVLQMNKKVIVEPLKLKQNVPESMLVTL